MGTAPLGELAVAGPEAHVAAVTSGLLGGALASELIVTWLPTHAAAGTAGGAPGPAGWAVAVAVGAGVGLAVGVALGVAGPPWPFAACALRPLFPPSRVRAATWRRSIPMT